MITIKCQLCDEPVDINAGRLCYQCGTLIPLSDYQEAKQIERAYKIELPAVLARINGYNSNRIDNINNAETTHQEGSDLIQKLAAYQSFYQDDFNTLKTETAALYANIQDAKQEEARRRQEAAERARWKARRKLIAGYTGTVVCSLAYWSMYIAIGLGVFILRNVILSADPSQTGTLIIGFGTGYVILGLVMGAISGYSLSGEEIKHGISGALIGGFIVFYLFLYFTRDVEIVSAYEIPDELNWVVLFGPSICSAIGTSILFSELDHPVWGFILGAITGFLLLFLFISWLPVTMKAKITIGIILLIPLFFIYLHISKNKALAMVTFLAIVAAVWLVWYYRNHFPQSVPSGMVFIEGGTFTMGSPASEPGRDNNEGPQHQVRVAPFYMGKYEVTVGEFRRFVNAAGYKTTAETSGGGSIASGDSFTVKADASWNNSYLEQTDQDPVVLVSWYDAVEYCNWRSAQEGLSLAYSINGKDVTCDWSAQADPQSAGYRLPTEAEWEYACRAGTAAPFNTGDTITTNQANYDGNYPYNGSAKGEFRETTTAAGTFEPNPWGLYDMHGNVYEWCWDGYADYASAAETDPHGPASGSARIYRGGSWYNSGRYIRSARRISDVPATRKNDLGFRLARSGGQAAQAPAQ
ncbi:MAG: SUMF1/EgtB/PvdO family nonheme iron enzyme [Treponema sp.]|jgi:formylglycine-generating enzyme required for sulfatase activity|nr:SUMF1/EgtB/PvdO family nonheme iron enzyme [Treponema sp.]